MSNHLAPNHSDLSEHIPSLDGLRALSIGLVVIGHAASTAGAPEWLDRPMVTSLGNIGVRFFFLISGFLITTLLLRDVARYGRIRIGQFYQRRALRILPAAGCYIAVIWTLYLAGQLDLTYHHGSRQHVSSAVPDLLHALTFTANYQHDYNWYFNHLWSLSVEEQFYLLWPLTVLALGVRSALFVGVGVLVAAPLIRVLMYMLGRGPDIAYSREFQAVCDALATGCVMAMLHARLGRLRGFTEFVRRFGIPMGGMLIAVGYGVAFVSRPLSYLIGQSAANIGIALLIQNLVRNPDDLIGRLFNLRPVALLGVLSYSLYLWQEPFLYFRNQSWIGSFPQNVMFAFGSALLSYWLVERPFLRLKRHLTASVATLAA